MRGHPIAEAPALTRVEQGSFDIDTSECLEFIDITDRVASRVAASGVQNGIVSIQSAHTTAAVLVNENEPLLIEDMKRVLERLAPRTDAYRHDAFEMRANLSPNEPVNGHAHCKAMFLRTSETIGVTGGRLQLGRWQRIFLVELDDARRRTVFINVLGQPLDR
jgi:secondary thiamine-phosphate synthase enzyme